MVDINNTPQQIEPRPFTFDRVVRILFSLAGVLGLIWVVNELKGVLLPFFVAWLIAYLLEPFVQYNRKLLRVKNRWLPITVTLLEVCLIFALIVVFVFPIVISEMHNVAAAIQKYVDLGSTISFIPAYINEFISDNVDFDLIYSKLTTENIQSIIDALGTVISGSYNFIFGVFSWFIVLLYLVFIMADYERLLVAFRKMVPPKYRDIVFRIGNDVKDSMNHYFRGQALVAFIVGILFSIGFMIIGLPMAIILGLFIGLLNLVPYLQLISLLPATLLCLVYSVDTGMNFWHIWLACMAVYIIVQCIQDLYLVPKIMGKAMGLNPAIILLSLSIWGSLLGFLGLIIALPLTTLLLSYYNTYIISRESKITLDSTTKGNDSSEGEV